MRHVIIILRDARAKTSHSALVREAKFEGAMACSVAAAAAAIGTAATNLIESC